MVRNYPSLLQVLELHQRKIRSLEAEIRYQCYHQQFVRVATLENEIHRIKICSLQVVENYVAQVREQHLEWRLFGAPLTTLLMTYQEKVYGWKPKFG